MIDHQDHRRIGVELTARIEDERDRRVLEPALAREPWFGFG